MSNFEPLIRLEDGDVGAESATPAANASRAGIVIHEQHAVRVFGLLDLYGEILAPVESPLNFHYSVAPTGAAFAGINVAGEHVLVNTDLLLYTLFDETGT